VIPERVPRLKLAKTCRLGHAVKHGWAVLIRVMTLFSGATNHSEGRIGVEYLRIISQCIVLVILLAILSGILVIQYSYDPEAAKKREDAARQKVERLLAELPDLPHYPPKVPKSLAKVFESATEIKVVSLNPEYTDLDPSKFVIGSVVIRDPVELKSIRDAIYQSIADGNGYADCL
jgi:hypothetical protein